MIELQQLCRGTEGEKEQLRQQNEESTLSIKSKEEEIDRQRAQQNQLSEWIESVDFIFFRHYPMSQFRYILALQRELWAIDGTWPVEE